MSSHTVYIDDADKSKIHYRTIELGPYRGRGFQPLDNQGDGVYDGTLSVTDVEDVSAVVTFTGTRVSVYGSLRAALSSDVPSPLTKYSIPEWDYGGIPAMTPYQAPSVTEPRDKVNFFTSDVLPLGTYSLWINVTTASPDAPFYLDYIAVVVPGAAPVSSSSQAAPSTSPPPARVTTVTTAPPPSSSSAAAPPSRPPTTSLLESLSGTPSTSASTSGASHALGSAVTLPGSTVTIITSSHEATESGASATLTPNAGFLSHSSFPVGAIVGAAVGGALLLLGALLALCICIRRRRRYAMPTEYDYGEGTVAQKDPEPHITPFVDPSFGVGMVQAGDRGLMFVPARNSMNSQSTRPTSPPGSPYSKSRTVSPQPQSDRTSGGGMPVSDPILGHKRSLTFQSILSDRPLSSGSVGMGPAALDPMSSRPSSGAVDVPPGIEVPVPMQQASVEGLDELPPPVYSASPRSDENHRAGNLDSSHPGAVAM
ncbi:hypothetical protein OH76DRAFT_1405728 [Lentinus brumalis]|uniref:Uncharacterized protein n=1 Tax=Lentinus brumalis TaxID=2498619 RepID=A0A371D580_9APHY|nr:hypothetical protein OH76DRAFT_1405728 [Polyporus brumalis]